MARSYTKKKYAKQSKPSKCEIQTASNIATDYIKQWTAREIGKLQIERSSPLCIPIKNGYKIGLYNLKINFDKTCDVFDPNQEFVHQFENKISAILYTIYISRRQYWRSDEILHCDQKINKCYTDVVNLRHTIEQAQKRKDYITVDTRMPRLEIAETRLNLAREQILKIHKTAKYYKIWE